MSYYQDLVRQSRLYPVLLLEEVIGHRVRHRLTRFILLLLFLLLLAFLGNVFWPAAFGGIAGKLLGLWLVLFSLLVVLNLLNGYFHVYYFRSIISNEYRPEDLFTFTVGRILFRIKDDDLLKGFLQSPTGRKVMRRCGVGDNDLAVFLSTRQSRSPFPGLPQRAGEILFLNQVTEWLFQVDPEFKSFLTGREIGLVELSGACRFVGREIESEAVKERWWARENLERLPGLAKDWAYGEIYHLRRFGRDLLESEEVRPTALHFTAYADEVRQIETILSRSREANVLVVGPPQAKLEVVIALAREIKSGRITPLLESKRLILLQTALFLATVKDKNVFEQETLRLLSEAARSGNVILAIDNLAALVLAADNFGSNLSDLFAPYLGSASLPVIALADADSFNQTLQPRASLLRQFERVQVREADPVILLERLEALAVGLERQYGVWFTYRAITALAESAARYFPDEEMAERAGDLLIEIVPWGLSRRQTVFDRREALEFVSGKTNIPLGEIQPSEKEKLLNLEDLLGERIVGQRRAIKGVSNALRRSRAATRNPKRPIGSFLFLGPTGVGKTETAKALAEVFFGAEEDLRRLDMTEYRGSDALERLIGSFASGRPGVLASLLREHPYGVILLDEFEKSHPDVLNLFLQVLDEGFFSDMLGRRVNARNVIFIATSNAGAEFIWQMMQAGRNPADRRDDLIDYLVTSNLFRPELLNRFDDIVIFHPLTQNELQQVARLLLVRLADRLETQGIELTVDADLVRQVAEQGSNKLFGARPMSRYIQDVVEQSVAQKIIAGDLGPGSRVEFRIGEGGKSLTPIVGKRL